MREKGTIKRYFPDRGFGFIMQVHKKDRFFHVRDVIGAEENEAGIEAGVSVEFEPIENTRGPAAANIELIPGA